MKVDTKIVYFFCEIEMYKRMINIYEFQSEHIDYSRLFIVIVNKKSE